MSTEVKCAACGRVLTQYDTRMRYADNDFCTACYDKSSPYLDKKPFWTRPGDELASMRSDKIIRCGKCSKDLGPLDVRAQDGDAIYCESCYREVRNAPGERRFFLAERAGMSTRPGTTALRDAGNLVECENCGYVATRDRLETFPKDARGKLRCPRCGKKFTTAGAPAPAKAKQEPSKPEKPGAADFAVTAQLFKCLGDPCRVRIIESLSVKELCVFEFVDLTGAQYSAVSYHLKMLKDLGIVRSFERGNFVVYSLTDKGQIVHEFIEKSKGLG